MLSALDVIIIIFILGGAFLGTFRGLVAEIIALTGVLVGILMASQFYMGAAAALEPVFRDHEISLFVGFMALFLAGMVAFFVVYLLVKSTMADKTPGPLNRICAALIGGVKNIIFIATVIFVIIFLWSPDNSFTSSSKLLPRCLPYCRTVVKLLPEPMQGPLFEYLDDLAPAMSTERKGV
jgi:membrane protein required for colicin V production